MPAAMERRRKGDELFFPSYPQNLPPTAQRKTISLHCLDEAFMVVWSKLYSM